MHDGGIAGRDDVLDRITVALDPRRDGRAGRAPVVVVRAVRGQGRSALVAELVRRAPGGRPPIVLATAPDGARRDLAAVAPLLDPAAPAELPDVLRVDGRRVPEAAVGSPVLVVVDDAHWLDARSAHVLGHLVAAGRAALLLTVPVGVPVRRPLVERDPVAVVELAPLDRAALDACVQRAHPAVDRSILEATWPASAGHPLLALAIAHDHVRAGGDGRADDGGPGAARPIGPAAASSHVALVAERLLDGLGAGARRAAEVLAAGTAVPMAALGDLGHGAGARALLRAGLAVADARGWLALTPPALASGVLGGLGASGAVRHCRRLAQRWPVSDTAPGPVRWRLDGELRAPADWWLAAARAAEDAHEPVVQQRCAEAARAAGGGAPATVELARALSALGQGVRADALFAEVLARGAGAGATTAGGHDESERLDVVVARAWNLGFVLQQPAEAQRLLAATEVELADAAARAELVCLRASLALHSAGPDAALAAATRTAVRPGGPGPGGPGPGGPGGPGERGGSADADLRACAALAPALSSLGRWEQSAALVDDFLRRADGARAAAPLTRLRLGAVRLWALVQLGRIDDARAEGDELAREADRAGRTGDAAVWLLASGYASLVAGLVVTADAALARAEDGLRRVDLFGYLPVCLASRARAHALSGRPTDAVAALAEAARLAASSHPFTALDPAADDAWLAACRGDLAGAAARTAGAVARAAESGHLGIALRLVWDLATFGRVDEAARRAADLGPHVEGALAATIVDGVAALARGDGDALGAVADRFAGLGAWLHAHAAAVGAADAHAAAGRAAAAAVAGQRATVLLTRCEGAGSPLAWGPGHTWLTPREREVATLASRGLSNQAIAEHLAVSARTVETHLHRVYAKLGVSGRGELAATWG